MLLSRLAYGRDARRRAPLPLGMAEASKRLELPTGALTRVQRSVPARTRIPEQGLARLEGLLLLAQLSGAAILVALAAPAP